MPPLGAAESNWSSRDTLAVTVLLTAAFGSRFFGLGTWDLVQDEYFTVIFGGERLFSFSNPLYYWLSELSRKLIDSTEFAVRLPTAIAGTLVPAVIYATWRQFIGRYGAICAAVLILLAEWHIRQSQYARFYEASFLFASLAYYLYLRGVLLGDWRRLALSFIAAGLAASFHMMSALVVVGCAVMSLLVVSNRVAGLGENSRRLAWGYLLVCVVGGLAVSPVLFDGIMARQAVRASWGTGPLRILLDFVENAEVVILCASLAGWLFLRRRDRFLSTFFFVGIGTSMLPFLLGASFMALRTDYVFHAMPLVYVLAGVCVSETRRALEPAGLSSHFLFALLAASLLPKSVSYYSARMTLDVRDAVAFLESRYSSGDHVIIRDTGLRYYLRESLPLEDVDFPSDREALRARLGTYTCRQANTWIAMRAHRRPYDAAFEAWLLENTQLVWRRFARRFDYHVEGYEVYLVNRAENCLAQARRSLVLEP